MTVRIIYNSGNKDYTYIGNIIKEDDIFLYLDDRVIGEIRLNKNFISIIIPYEGS